MKKIKRIVQILVIPFLLCIPAQSFALNVGDKAPLFTAQSTHGRISLGDFSGNKNVLLALYFAVFTSV